MGGSLTENLPALLECLLGPLDFSLVHGLGRRRVARAGSDFTEHAQACLKALLQRGEIVTTLEKKGHAPLGGPRRDVEQPLGHPSVS